MKKIWPFIFPSYLIAHHASRLFPRPGFLWDHVKYFIQQNLTPFHIEGWIFITTFLIFGLFLYINKFLLSPCCETTKKRHMVIDWILYASFFLVYIPFSMRVYFKGGALDFLNDKSFWGKWYVIHFECWVVIKLVLLMSLFFGKERRIVFSHLKNKSMNFLKWLFGKGQMPETIAKIHLSLTKPYNLNWLFILILFIYLGTINAYLAWTFEINGISGNFRPYFFAAIALMLTLLQLSLFVFLWQAIQQLFPKILKSLAHIALCAYILARGIEVFLLKNIQLDLYNTYQYLIQDPNLLASRLGLSLITIKIIILSWFILSFVLFFIFKITEKLTKQLSINHYLVLSIFSILLTTITCLNLYSHKFTNTMVHSKYQKILPFPYAMPILQHEHISLPSHIPNLPDRSEIADYLAKTEFIVDKKPDIYIFILESFRGDFVTPELSPNIYDFKQKSISFPNSFSGATCTWHSWYSLFHSRPSYEWREAMMREHNIGSLFLNGLQKAGYKIHALSHPFTINNNKYKNDKSFQQATQKRDLFANLNSWEKFQDVCFGQQRDLINYSLAEETWDPKTLYGQPADADKEIIMRAIRTTANSTGGNIYFITLDAGHWVYSWTDDSNEIYEPSNPSDDGSISTRTLNQQEREIIINQYKNTYKCMDKRVGEMLNALKQRGQYDNSVIIIIGDHGEACFEHEYLGHGGPVYHETTNIPIYYKFLASEHEEMKKLNKTTFTVQMDIFPTLFDYLGLQPIDNRFILGESIFKKTKNYTILTTPNMYSHPWRIAFCNDKHKCMLKFNHPNIFKATKLNLISYSDLKDNEIIHDMSKSELESKIYAEFKPALDLMFGDSK